MISMRQAPAKPQPFFSSIHIAPVEKSGPALKPATFDIQLDRQDNVSLKGIPLGTSSHAQPVELAAQNLLQALSQSLLQQLNTTTAASDPKIAIPTTDRDSYDIASLPPADYFKLYTSPDIARQLQNPKGIRISILA